MGTQISDTDAEDDDPRILAIASEQHDMMKKIDKLMAKMDSPAGSPQGPSSTSRPGGSDSEGMVDSGVDEKADELIRRLHSHRKVLGDDRQQSPGDPTAGSSLEPPKTGKKDKKGKKNQKERVEEQKDRKKKKKKKDKDFDSSSDSDGPPPIASDVSSDSDDDKSDDVSLSIEQLKQESRNPRKVVLRRLSALSKKTQWRLKHGLKERVAPTLVARAYKRGGSVLKLVLQFILDHHLEGCPDWEPLKTVARSMDKMIMDPNCSDDSVINSEILELLARKIYGHLKGYERVKTKDDWRRPSSASNKAWTSLVNTALIKEYDQLEDDELIPDIAGADSEVRGRLKTKALFNKHAAPSSS